MYIKNLSPPIGVFNYFTSISHCNLQKELLLNIFDLLKNKILPTTENIFNDVNYDNENIDTNDVVICGMNISEYKAFIQYLEVCIHFQALIQIWEQQIVSTIFYSLGRTNRIIKTKKDKSENKDIEVEMNVINYSDFDEVLLLFDINTKNWRTWEKISEIRHIVNVIKHSMGRSLDFVKKNYSDIVFYDENTGYDNVTFSHSSLLDFNINFHEKLDEYINYLIMFWDEVANRVIKIYCKNKTSA